MIKKRLAEWKYKKISDCVESLRGGIAIAPSDFTEAEENTVVHKGDVTYDGLLNLTGRQSRFVKSIVKLKNPQAVVTPDYLVVSLRDLVPDTPQLGLINQIPDKNKLVLAQGTYGFKVKSKLILPEFLCLISATFEYRKLMRLVAVGSTQKHMRSSEFFNLKIPVPSLSDQSKICEPLQLISKNIEHNEKLIAKKRDIKQATMQQLLTGKTRLSGFSGKWDVLPLGLIADPRKEWSFTGGPFGSNLKSADYTTSGVRIIQLQNIGDGEFRGEYEIYTSTKKADELKSCNIFPGEIILSKMGDPVARACLIPDSHDRFLMCSDGIRLAVNTKIHNTYYIYSQINAPEFRTKANNAGTGSTRKRIGLTELRGITIGCPALAEQNAIAKILSDMNVELSSLRTKLEKLKLLKQGMMQELLTGRIRLV